MKRTTKQNRRRRKQDPMPDKQRILDFLAQSGKPRRIDRIAEALGITDDAGGRLLEKQLRAMQQEGLVIRNRRGGYGPVDKMDLLSGTVTGHPDGYGFMKADAGGSDLYLSPREMKSLMHGDRILAQVTGVDRRGRREGAVVEVLERANRQVVGRYLREGGIGFVVPDNKRLHLDVLIPAGSEVGAKSGQYVVAEIVRPPDRHTPPAGKITSILGDHMTADMAATIAMLTFDLPYEWPPAVLREAGRFGRRVIAADQKGREDLRNLPFITIDGEDARDFDDAVYCERQGKGWRLLVAIADVSHYVRAGSALDREAALRGNSVYFPRRVIPMLPEILSNELCSLNPAVDRLCMVCELNINSQGGTRRYRFFEGVIRSAARMTYNGVAAILAGENASQRKAYKPLVPHLENLYTLYQLLHRRRKANALIDFESTESWFEFADDGRVLRIHALERNDAHRMIEEFMLAANIAAGEFLEAQGIPCLYRVHDTPAEEKLDDLRTFLGELGLQLGGGDQPQARDYARLIDRIRDREDRHLIETVLLRSLPLAVYRAVNVGHFGLGFPVYAHFTSPIRRYPDLLIHRAIRHLLRRATAGGFNYSRDDMERYGKHCSMTERRADEATREIVRWYKCDYMREKVGEVFNGVISGVTSFGLFVELNDIFVEGLVHVTALPIDYYHFDPIRHRLRGERSGRNYRLANRVRVKVTRVDVDDKKIDFELVED